MHDVVIVGGGPVGLLLAGEPGLSAVLVRPDGIVAWAAERAPDPDSFERTVTRWFAHSRGGH
jgi:hypothetical protein